jgi:hypothetical protein
LEKKEQSYRGHGQTQWPRGERAGTEWNLADQGRVVDEISEEGSRRLLDFTRFYTETSLQNLGKEVRVTVQQKSD